jgi:hypothetical protein
MGRAAGSTRGRSNQPRRLATEEVGVRISQPSREAPTRKGGHARVPFVFRAGGSRGRWNLEEVPGLREKLVVGYLMFVHRNRTGNARGQRRVLLP